MSRGIGHARPVLRSLLDLPSGGPLTGHDDAVRIAIVRNAAREATTTVRGMILGLAPVFSGAAEERP